MGQTQWVKEVGYTEWIKYDTPRAFGWHPECEHRLEDGRVLRMLEKGILVREDPLPTTSASGLVVLPEGSVETIHHTGTILAYGFMVGDGRAFPIPDIRKGLKCAYIRFLREQHTNQRWREMFDGIFRIGVTDVELVWEPGEKVVIG